MPARVKVTDGSLVVAIEGADRIWALKSRLEVPLEHVLGAERDSEEASGWWHGVRALGAHVPGVISAGRFHEHGERVFWDVHDPEKAIAIRLLDERFARLVVEVEDPDETVSRINAALAPVGTTGANER